MQEIRCENAVTLLGRPPTFLDFEACSFTSTAVPAPHYVAELLDEANGLIALMARESLPSVAKHAGTLHRLATDAGALEIASAARDLESIRMGRTCRFHPRCAILRRQLLRRGTTITLTIDPRFTRAESSIRLDALTGRLSWRPHHWRAASFPKCLDTEKA